MTRSKISITIYIVCIFLYQTGLTQVVKSVVPDSGRQNSSFGITVNGTGTEWSLSTYFQIYFDSIGVTAYNVAIINDSTLTATVNIAPKAAVGWRQIICADQFQNYYYKDSALRVILWFPATPTLILPLNNSQNQLQNPVFLWDSNGYATYFKLQIAEDSNFINVVIDTNLTNPPVQIPPNILLLGTKYYWRVRATNSIGNGEWSEVWNFRVRTVGIKKIEDIIPEQYKLFQNYPNPFNPFTNIKILLPQESPLKVVIYDLTGKVVEILFDGVVKSGIYILHWNAAHLPSGIYFCKMLVPGYYYSIKLVLLK
ncbi:MAG: T9SS type A sorting domain-containing protein [Ignavibacteria bacterium]